MKYILAMYSLHSTKGHKNKIFTSNFPFFSIHSTKHKLKKKNKKKICFHSILNFVYFTCVYNIAHLMSPNYFQVFYIFSKRCMYLCAALSFVNFIKNKRILHTLYSPILLYLPLLTQHRYYTCMYEYLLLVFSQQKKNYLIFYTLLWMVMETHIFTLPTSILNLKDNESECVSLASFWIDINI